VPAEERGRIFERFVRGSTARSQDDANRGDGRRVRGSGIGLALVKHIAESHGGKAWVEAAGERRGGSAEVRVEPDSTAPNPGASFAISIPVGAVGGRHGRRERLAHGES
jgi:two-component system, OmpR family, phosphate regulon sensor histidine kinase PhoR